MATTSLWHIKGRLKDLINYVENPEKTVSKDKCLQDFYNVFSYVSRPEATENGEYVSAINCLKEIALRQMIYPAESRCVHQLQRTVRGVSDLLCRKQSDHNEAPQFQRRCDCQPRQVQSGILQQCDQRRRSPGARIFRDRGAGASEYIGVFR